MIFPFIQPQDGTDPGYLEVAQTPYPRMLVLLTCDVTVLDVVISYSSTVDSGAYTIVSTTVANGSTTSALTGALGYGHATNRVLTNVQDKAGIAQSDQFASIFGAELSRQSLALAAPIVQRALTSDVVTITYPIIVTRYTFPSLIFFLATLVLNALVAVVVLIWTSVSTSPYVEVPDKRNPTSMKQVSSLVLAQMRLTKADSVIAAYFSDTAASKGVSEDEEILQAVSSASTDPRDIFREKSGDSTERLTLGLNQKGTKFGFRRITRSSAARAAVSTALDYLY